MFKFPKFNLRNIEKATCQGPFGSTVFIYWVWPWQRTGGKYLAQAKDLSGTVVQECSGDTLVRIMELMYSDYLNYVSPKKIDRYGLSVHSFDLSIPVREAITKVPNGEYLVYLPDSRERGITFFKTRGYTEIVGDCAVIEITNYEGSLESLVEVTKTLSPGRIFKVSKKNGYALYPEEM